jgi:prepilin-type N-terminal cleavage/methylation domain-containing protein
MHFINPPKSKQGLTMTEVLVSLMIFSMLSVAVWGNVFLQGRSYRYNSTSNGNVSGASLALNRIVYGNDAIWGLRVASRSGVSVVPSGITANGVAGWIATCRHNIDTDEDLPTALDTEEYTIVFNPVTRTITRNGQLIGEDVVNAYFTISSGNVSLGVQVETATGGLQAMVETLVRLRNS